MQRGPYQPSPLHRPDFRISHYTSNFLWLYAPYDAPTAAYIDRSTTNILVHYTLYSVASAQHLLVGPRHYLLGLLLTANDIQVLSCRSTSDHPCSSFLLSGSRFATFIRPVLPSLVVASFPLCLFPVCLQLLSPSVIASLGSPCHVAAFVARC